MSRWLPHLVSSQLHSWRIVADQLLSQKSSHSTGEGRSGTIASLGFCTAVRKIFFESGLDKLEMYEKLRSGKEVGSPRRGTLDKAKKGRSTDATARQEGDAMQIDDKVDPRTLQPSGAESQDSFTIFENGVLKEISKVGLVVKDGLLHHEELASRNLSVSFADQQKFQKWNVDAQTKVRKIRLLPPRQDLCPSSSCSPCSDSAWVRKNGEKSIRSFSTSIRRRG